MTFITEGRPKADFGPTKALQGLAGVPRTHDSNRAPGKSGFPPFMGSSLLLAADFMIAITIFQVLCFEKQFSCSLQTFSSVLHTFAILRQLQALSAWKLKCFPERKQ